MQTLTGLCKVPWILNFDKVSIIKNSEWTKKDCKSANLALDKLKPKNVSSLAQFLCLNFFCITGIVLQAISAFKCNKILHLHCKQNILQRKFGLSGKGAKRYYQRLYLFRKRESKYIITSVGTQINIEDSTTRTTNWDVFEHTLSILKIKLQIFSRAAGSSTHTKEFISGSLSTQTVTQEFQTFLSFFNDHILIIIT